MAAFGQIDGGAQAGGPAAGNQNLQGSVCLFHLGLSDFRIQVASDGLSVFHAMQATLQAVPAGSHRLWGPGFPLFDQVGIGDQGTTQRHNVGEIVVEDLCDPIRSAHAAGRDQRQVSLLAYPGQRIQLWFFRQTGMVKIPRRTGARRPHAHVHGMNSVFCGHLQQGRQVLRQNAELRRHFVAGYSQDTGQVRSAGFDCRQHLVGEQQTVLAIGIHSLVDFSIEELGHQVPMTPLNLDGVETGLDGLLGSGAISIHNGADLQFGQHFGYRTGGRAGQRRGRFGIDARCLGFGRRTAVVEMQACQTVFCMDYIYDFFQLASAFRKMNAQLFGVFFALRRDRHWLKDQ
jgi:hypothetical protein